MRLGVKVTRRIDEENKQPKETSIISPGYGRAFCKVANKKKKKKKGSVMLWLSFLLWKKKIAYVGKRDKEGLEWFCKQGQGKSTCYHFISSPYHNINPGHIEESNVQ